METTEVSEFGQTCRQMIVRSGVPLARAVRTKSSDRLSRVDARMYRLNAASAAPVPASTGNTSAPG